MTPEEIKALRKKRGWTQQQLAAEVGVAVSSVARWESQKGNPPKGAALRTIQRLMVENPSVFSDRPVAFDLPSEKMEYIESLIAQMSCPKDFQCVKSGFRELCKAHDIGLDSYLKCLDPNASDCLFSVLLNNRHLCQCPLRVFLAKQRNR